MGSHRAPRSCAVKKVSLQLSSEQSVLSGLGISQLDRKRVPEATSGGCKSSVAACNCLVFASVRKETKLFRQSVALILTTENR